MFYGSLVIDPVMPNILDFAGNSTEWGLISNVEGFSYILFFEKCKFRKYFKSKHFIKVMIEKD